jgi:rRNA maturation endonuclease Nob1
VTYPPPIADLVDLDDSTLDRARGLVAQVSDEEAEAIVQAQWEAIERRRVEREERRAWSPSYRCDRCHSFTSTATSVCPQCGHVGASNDEGQRTSYARAHRRRPPRKTYRR